MAIKDILKSSGAEKIITTMDDKSKRFTDIIHDTLLAPATLSRRFREFRKEQIVAIEYDPSDRTERYKLTDKGFKYLLFLLICELAGKFVEEISDEDNEILRKIIKEHGEEVIEYFKNLIRAPKPLSENEIEILSGILSENEIEILNAPLRSAPLSGKEMIILNARENEMKKRELRLVAKTQAARALAKT